MDADTISLRPAMAVGGNPFARFGKGAGFGMKKVWLNFC
jgi:hypothetical protein